MPDEFQYDVFLSHSTKDKAVVCELAERLRKDGLKVWFDESEIRPGDSIPSKIEEGLGRSRVLVLCMSAHAFGSDWAQLESQTFRFRDPLNKERLFIPLRLDDAPIKGSLAQFLFINWLPANREQEYAKFLEACKSLTKSPIELQQAVRAQITEQSLSGKRNSQMSIQESTIKRLFGMSRNQCAMPDCKSPLIIGDVVVGEICHIRARRKGGARYDPSMAPAQNAAFENLLLLCGTCHKLIDAAPNEYSADWLESIKRGHEGLTPPLIELSQADANKAMLILAKHIAKCSKSSKSAGDTTIHGGVRASATHGGISIAIGGTNQAPINIRPLAPKRSGTNYPANSIGADANMTNYIEELCHLYVKFMLPIEPDENKSWARLGKHIKTKFHLRKRTRNHLSAERFWDLVNYLVHEKLAGTPVGKKHLREGKKLCRTFDEFRHGEM